MAGPTSRRASSVAMLLPVLGAFLLMSPLITIFAGTRLVFGVPLIVAYVFGVWLFLLVAAAWLAMHLDEPAQEAQVDTPADAS